MSGSLLRCRKNRTPSFGSSRNPGRRPTIRGPNSAKRDLWSASFLWPPQSISAIVGSNEPSQGEDLMREPVIVSYARTGLAKAARGGFNNTPAVTMLAHAIKHAVSRAKLEPGEVEDVVAGQVAGSGNTGRNAALLAGLPI